MSIRGQCGLEAKTKQRRSEADRAPIGLQSDAAPVQVPYFQRLDTQKYFMNTPAFVKASVITLDLEGVLVPEIWIAFSEATRIPELRLTTRDIPDYDVLMKGRLKLLEENK